MTVEHKIVRDSRGYFCKVPHCWTGEYAMNTKMAEHEHQRFLDNSEPIEHGPVEKCRECGREEWGHSWLDHMK